MKVINTNKKSKIWSGFKKTLWFLCVMSMFVVCCITIAIVYANKNLIKLEITNETTVLISVVGFLLSVSSISIYSIFNANMQEEKTKLHDLQDRFAAEMELNKERWDFLKLLIMYHSSCQMIVNSQSFNFQIYDWINSLKRNKNSIKQYLVSRRHEYQQSLFSNLKSDFLEMSRGISIQLNSFSNHIKDNNSAFFNRVSINDKNYFLQYIKETVNEIEMLENDDFMPES